MYLFQVFLFSFNLLLFMYMYVPACLYALHVYAVSTEARRYRAAGGCELPYGYSEPNPVFSRTAINLNWWAIFQHHIFTNFYLESFYR